MSFPIETHRITGERRDAPVERCPDCDGDGVTGTSPDSPPCRTCQPEARDAQAPRRQAIEALRMSKGGRLYHAVDSPDGPGRPLYRAECGKEPASSSGWDTLNPGREVTCPACRMALACTSLHESGQQTLLVRN